VRGGEVFFQIVLPKTESAANTNRPPK